MCKPRTCSTEGCEVTLKFPEEFENLRCAVCMARADRHPKQNPKRYSLIPGLLEILDLADELRMTPGTPDRVRGKAERTREITIQLIQNQRDGRFDSAALENQLQLLLWAQEELSSLTAGYDGRETLPTGEVTTQRLRGQPGSEVYRFEGTIMKRNIRG